MPAPPARPARQVRPEADLYAAAEVARLFRVHRRVPNRWAKAGKLPGEAVIRTPGAHRRYDADYIDGIVNGGQR